MPDSFHCTVVTPEAQVFDDEVSSAILPAHDGQMGVLALHAPMMVELGEGELKLGKSGDADTSLQIQGGFAQVQNNQLVVLADKATEA